jgi:hypothetical protein
MDDHYSSTLCLVYTYCIEHHPKVVALVPFPLMLTVNNATVYSPEI